MEDYRPIPGVPHELIYSLDFGMLRMLIPVRIYFYGELEIRKKRKIDEFRFYLLFDVLPDGFVSI